MGRRSSGIRVYGPSKHGRQWRIEIRDGSTRFTRSYATYEEAVSVREEVARQGREVSVLDALAKYVDHHRERGMSVAYTNSIRQRIRSFFGFRKVDAAGARRQETGTDYNVRSITPAIAARLLATYAKDKTAETQRGTILDLRRFAAWLVAQRLMAASPFDALQHKGRRERGKPQLSMDESMQLIRTCLAAIEAGDESGVAVLLALILGCRASEIADLKAGDIDDKGTVLWIRKGKTRNASRRIGIPDFVQALIARVVAGKQRNDDLWPGRNRHWVSYHVVRLCKLAGVSRVTAHGLRGTWSTVATEAHAAPHIVAAALGHDSFAVTSRHYAASGSVDSSQAQKMAKKLVTESNNSVTKLAPSNLVAKRTLRIA